MSSKITETTQDAAFQIVKEYQNIFKDHKSTDIVPVIRIKEKSIFNAIKIANKLREMSGIAEDKPIDYQHTFELIETLGINVIFRYFPKSLKSYAFYTKIYDHRVIFINNSTNILDLIFPILHESVHAIRDELSQIEIYDDEDEEFCDLVANFIQFPDSYVKMVFEAIKPLSNPLKINTLKTFAKTNSHSLYGIVKAIKVISPQFSLNVGGADSNLRKDFFTIGDIIYSKKDVNEFILILKTLSKNFLSILFNQLDNISTRKLGDILGIDNVLDAQLVRNELKKELSFAMS
jgi:Zn-dependent peptidase ImmA (M78 family)